MGITIGIDIGGSTTKIVGYKNGKVSGALLVRADDPLTSIYGAFGRFVSSNKIPLTEIERVMITGVGSSYVTEKLYGLPTGKVTEFNAVGLGGLFLSGLQKAIIISLGTGTSFVHSDSVNLIFKRMGGTGIGGGMLNGLAGLMLNIRDFDIIIDMAKHGNLNNIDLTVGKMTKDEIINLSPEATAANFGDVSDIATKEDIALGILNLIYQSVGMMAIFLSGADNKDVVVTGNLSSVGQARELFEILERLFDVNFHIPESSQYATAVGAALAFHRGVDFIEL